MQQKEDCNKKNAAARRHAFQLLQGAGLYGAGDFLMSFLGVIILSFAFKIFDQRRLMVRHAPEILGSCVVSAGVSMLGTAVLCRLAGLDSSRPSSASLYLHSLFVIGSPFADRQALIPVGLPLLVCICTSSSWSAVVLCGLAGLDPRRAFSASWHACSLCMIGNPVLCRLAASDLRRPFLTSVHMCFLFMTVTASLRRLAGLDPRRPFFSGVHACSLCMIGNAVLCRLAGLDPSRPSST